MVLHSRLAQEAGQFELADVARGLSEKMIRRSPHVFHADGTLQSSFPASIAEIEASWERVKAEERAAAEVASGPAGNPSLGPRTRGPHCELASDGSVRGVRFSPLVPHSENPSSLREPRPDRVAESARNTSPAQPATDGPFAGIPRSLPALAMAQKSLERAERAGLNLGESRGDLGGPFETEDELGQVLFDVVRAAQERGLDAERALRLAVRAFQTEI